eukprot:gb/GECG01015814.1/.p1 GENE.gb/GECG01015814.1/~~gb/GECG01015814.1/.p1  ORF type:complete len:446 (+),score=52.21 gb/GECG01015814.1/:1-1338(+)
MDSSNDAKRARVAEDAPTPPQMHSWVEVPEGSDFTIYNIPFGVFRPNPSEKPRVGTAIGNYVVDLSVLAHEGLFGEAYADTFHESSLNAFMAQGRPAWKDARRKIQALLTGDDARLKNNNDLRNKALIDINSVTMELPAVIGDYTDFYSSKEHATNVGTMFRGKDNALQPNWTYLPVGYHGRSSSVIKSGIDIHRPQGQLQKDPNDAHQGSTFGPCKLMDFELEMGTFVGPGNEMGKPIAMSQAEDHIFGLTLMNDWSARDIQKWEYVPLGPFTAKNFATTISPWVVTLEALEPFRSSTSAGEQNPEPHGYLKDPNYGSYDIQLDVYLKTPQLTEPYRLCHSNFSNLYWNIKQQLVHHSVTGCNMRPGDCLGSGTISGSTPDSYGSMLELCWKGTNPIKLPNGEERKFLQDGDEVVMKGYCQKAHVRIGFGDCRGKVLSPVPIES